MSETGPRGQAIFLTGPPLAGKTTTAMKWAAERKQPTAPLDWDELHAVLFRGDNLRASTSVHNRYRFAAKTAIATAAHVTALGLDCVISGARVPWQPSDPPEWLGHWDDLDQLDPITIVLLPTVEVRLERLRRNPGHPFDEEQVRQSHLYGWERWFDHPRAAVLDTSDLSEEEVVEAVELAAQRLSGQPAP